jgi:hypothetical protein
LRPKNFNSTSSPPSRAPGTPSTAMISELRYVRYVEPSPNCAPRMACR